ncbi:unnamed protein product [Prorocentrum cordatum]|uniref:Uncharacterized protein n=1 Tax=Prorocentrum cordatum TaxID=2364126 RepID=A0ABN9U8I4_9DINO|nr:unnamed protein product [Polarella glacialis]
MTTTSALARKLNSADKSALLASHSCRTCPSRQSGHLFQAVSACAIGADRGTCVQASAGLRASASPESYNIQTHQGNQATSAKLRRNKWINRQVTQNSNNMQRLLQTIHYHISEMNAINLVTALHRLTKLAVSGTTEYTVDRLLKERRG